MSTLKVAAINNPSASSGGLAISASGNVTGAGLDLITTQSFSAVSSVSLNNCFSASYDNYLILCRMTGPTAGVTMRLRSGGADNSASNYNLQETAAYSTTVIGSRQTGLSNWTMPQTISGEYNVFTMNLFNPFTSSKTTAFQQYGYRADSASSLEIYHRIFAHTLDASFDGFSLIQSSLTGSLSVYGHRK